MAFSKKLTIIALALLPIIVLSASLPKDKNKKSEPQKSEKIDKIRKIAKDPGYRRRLSKFLIKSNNAVL